MSKMVMVMKGGGRGGGEEYSRIREGGVKA